MELSANPNIVQKFVVCNDSDRLAHISNVISAAPRTKTLIFCATKRACEILGLQLMRLCSLQMAVLHGDKTQIQRNSILADFRVNRLTLVIATDVAARGLDVVDIERVINFDFPQNIESYVHRIGRTARAGKSGESLSYITPNNHVIVDDIIELLHKSNQPVPQDLSDINSGGSGSPPQRSRMR